MCTALVRSFCFISRVFYVKCSASEHVRPCCAARAPLSGQYWLRTYASLTLFRRADELFLLSHGMRACRIAEAEQLLAIAESNKCALPLLRLACSFLWTKSESRLAVPTRMANANLPFVE